jgi:hypothetical protein
MLFGHGEVESGKWHDEERWMKDGGKGEGRQWSGRRRMVCV